MPATPSPAPPHPDATWLTDAEVASYLHVSRSQVWKLVARGVLPEPRRLGRSTRWHKPTLDEAPGRERAS